MAKENKDDPLRLSLAEESILKALVFQERYALETGHAITEAIKGRKKIGFSSLFPNLGKLEKPGFVTCRWVYETPE